MLEHVTTGIVCERESAHGGGTQEDMSTMNFGHVWVLTQAASVAGQCFVHCDMPLGQDQNSIQANDRAKMEKARQ